MTASNIHDEDEILWFRNSLRHFPAGVAVVTVADGTDVWGMTATSFTTVSLDPKLCSVSVNTPGRMHKLLIQTDGVFGMSILHAKQGPYRGLLRQATVERRTRCADGPAQRLPGPRRRSGVDGL